MSTANWGLEQITPGQSNAESAHNEAINRIDSLIHLKIADRDLSAPPIGVNGAVYLPTPNEWAITDADSTGDFFKVSGDQTSKIADGDRIVVSGSSLNDGTYTVDSTSFGSGETTINVVEAVPDETTDGDIYHLEGSWNWDTINNMVPLGKLAYYYSGWKFLAPQLGALGYVVDETSYISYTAGGWTAFSGGGGSSVAAVLPLGTVARYDAGTGSVVIYTPTGGLSATNAQRGANFIDAHGDCDSGDILWTGPGTYTFPLETNFARADNEIHMYGAGRKLTRLNIVTDSGSSDFIGFEWAHGMHVESMGIFCVESDETTLERGFPFGRDVADTTGGTTVCSMRDCYVAGEIDAIQAYEANGGATMVLTVEDCELYSPSFDVTNFGGAGLTVYMRNCVSTAVRGLYCVTDALVIATNCRIHVTGGSGALIEAVTTTDGTIKCYNCQLSSENPGGGATYVYDVHADSFSGTGLIELHQCSFNRGKLAVDSGSFIKFEGAAGIFVDSAGGTSAHASIGTYTSVPFGTQAYFDPSVFTHSTSSSNTDIALRAGRYIARYAVYVNCLSRDSFITRLLLNGSPVANSSATNTAVNAARDIPILKTVVRFTVSTDGHVLNLQFTRSAGSSAATLTAGYSQLELEYVGPN